MAFSGGVDSTLVLYAARQALGDGALAFHAASPLHIVEEQERAERLAALVGCRLVRFALNPLAWPQFVANPPDRCYLCKKHIYSQFSAALAQFGCNALLDGTNIDDLGDQRPGLAAVRELGVATPLVAAGFRKEDVRLCSRESGLPTWDQLSSSCLATRIRAGQPITPENIDFVARCEKQLLAEGFAGCRVRWGATALTIEVQEADYSRLVAGSASLVIQKTARGAGFTTILFATRKPL